MYDVSAKNLGFDITSLDLASGELRLIEVKGLGASTGPSCSRPTSAASPKTGATAIGSTSSPAVTQLLACRIRSATRRASPSSRHATHEVCRQC
jgi:uncharacterized protein DUF3883